MTREMKARSLRRAVQLWAMSMTDESAMMEVAGIYPAYRLNTGYKAGDIFRHGEDQNGDPQLYQVLSAHVSAPQWKPEESPSLYKKIGVTAGGVMIWTQPLGAGDAYMQGDRVSFEGEIWQSDIDANVWQPGVYGWSRVQP